MSGVELVDHAFECAGGEGSVAAIEQIIDRINRGTVSLLGVSENNVPINTRMVLEKGLRLFGRQPQLVERISRPRCSSITSIQRCLTISPLSSAA